MVRKPFNKILVSIDDSKNSRRGLKFALNIAKQTESSVIGLNVCSLPTLIKKSPAMIQKIKQKSNEIVNQAKKTAEKTNVPFIGIIKFNKNIGKTIVSVAENHRADLIIICSRGPDPEAGLFLGSVANYVVNRSKIPVTVIK